MRKNEELRKKTNKQKIREVTPLTFLIIFCRAQGRKERREKSRGMKKKSEETQGLHLWRHKYSLEMHTHALISYLFSWVWSAGQKLIKKKKKKGKHCAGSDMMAHLESNG